MLAEELLVQERPTTMAETTPREIRAIPPPRAADQGIVGAWRLRPRRTNKEER